MLRNPSFRLVITLNVVLITGCLAGAWRLNTRFVREQAEMRARHLAWHCANPTKVHAHAPASMPIVCAK